MQGGAEGGEEVLELRGGAEEGGGGGGGGEGDGVDQGGGGRVAHRLQPPAHPGHLQMEVQMEVVTGQVVFPLLRLHGIGCRCQPCSRSPLVVLEPL